MSEAVIAPLRARSARKVLESAVSPDRALMAATSPASTARVLSLSPTRNPIEAVAFAPAPLMFTRPTVARLISGMPLRVTSTEFPTITGAADPAGITIAVPLALHADRDRKE